MQFVGLANKRKLSNIWKDENVKQILLLNETILFAWAFNALADSL